MEIISYVGYDNKRYRPGIEKGANRFTAWVSRRAKVAKPHEKWGENWSENWGEKWGSGWSERKAERKTARKTTRRAERKAERKAERAADRTTEQVVARWHEPFTFKKFLIQTGKFVRVLEDNALKITISILSFAFVVAAVFGFLFLSNWTSEHTKPLEFEVSGTEEELLERCMQKFACDAAEDYLSDGTLVDAVFPDSYESLFTQPVTFQTYRVQSGDTISGITKKFGLGNISTIIAVNHIENVRLITAGKKLKIPSTDGLIYTVQRGNTLQGLSAKFSVPLEKLLDINELESAELSVGQELFIPGARMGTNDLLQALGELFKLPIHAKFRYTSLFGPRTDPISGAKSNHTGIDMACPTGTPIFASCPGTVAFVGYSNIFGNYVILKHANGYQSLYGHMSKILVKKGQLADQNTKLGLVGSTGYSTGPHLHFTVYKNGKLVDPMSVLK